MANIVDVEIITPDRVFYSGKATMIEFNTTEGEIGVLPNHIALTTVIAPGIVTISTEEEQVKAAVDKMIEEHGKIDSSAPITCGVNWVAVTRLMLRGRMLQKKEHERD